MAKYCYIILNNSGFSWMALNGQDETAADGKPAVLPRLLEEGWEPVRETPMGGGSGDVSHSLILLEKREKKAVGRPARK